MIGTALRTQQRYTADAADALAAAIGLFGFLSLLPLIAIAVAIGALVLGGDPQLQQQIVDGAVESVPALSTALGGQEQLDATIRTVEDAAPAILSISFPLVLLAGLRVVNGAMQASAVVFRREIPTGVVVRLKQVGWLAILGTFALLAAAVGGSVGVDLGGAEALVVSSVTTAVSVVLDIVLFWLAYRLLTPGEGPGWRTLLPGAVLAGIGWTALKVGGSLIIQSNSENELYAGIGGIIGLLVILYFAGRLYLYGLELNAVLASDRELPDHPAHTLYDADPQPADDVDRAPPRPDAQPTPAAAVGMLLSAAAVAVLSRLLPDGGE